MMLPPRGIRFLSEVTHQLQAKGKISKQLDPQ